MAASTWQCLLLAREPDDRVRDHARPEPSGHGRTCVRPHAGARVLLQVVVVPGGGRVCMCHRRRVSDRVLGVDVDVGEGEADENEAGEGEGREAGEGAAGESGRGRGHIRGRARALIGSTARRRHGQPRAAHSRGWI